MSYFLLRVSLAARAMTTGSCTAYFWYSCPMSFLFLSSCESDDSARAAATYKTHQSEVSFTSTHRKILLRVEEERHQRFNKLQIAELLPCRN